MPLMGKMAELPEASVDLKLLLVQNPPWRPQFFSYFPQSITDARTPLDVLLSVKASSNPPSIAELRPYLDFLIQHGFFDLAYYTWLQFLPPEQLAHAGHLYNGNFDAPPSGSPFDWVLTKSTGVTAQLAATSDRQSERALQLRFGPGRVDYQDVYQLVMLRPGHYQFRGRYKSELVSERGLEWRVVCASKDQNIVGQGLVNRGTSAQWQDLEFSFTVPETDCPAQFVKLVFDARSASEKFISGNIWFDDFKITREQTQESGAANPSQQLQTGAAPQAAAPQLATEPATASENPAGTTPEQAAPASQPEASTAPPSQSPTSTPAPQEAPPSNIGTANPGSPQEASPGVQPNPIDLPPTAPAPQTESSQ
jgi:hypothetical protein